LWLAVANASGAASYGLRLALEILSIYRVQKILPIFPLPKDSSQDKKSIREKGGLFGRTGPAFLVLAQIR